MNRYERRKPELAANAKEAKMKRQTASPEVLELRGQAKSLGYRLRGRGKKYELIRSDWTSVSCSLGLARTTLAFLRKQPRQQRA